MPVLAAATLELNANSAKLEQDLGRAVQSAAAFGTAIGEVMGQAISKGIDKLVGMVNQAVATGDELNKLSQKTGMSVESLSELRAAAELSGVSLGTVKTAVTQLYEALSNSQRTGGDNKAAQAFEAIGLDIDKLRAQKPDELFKTVTQRLAEYEDGANRAAIQTAIFGRSGKELSPLINDLAKTTELAKQLGLTMDKETSEAAERFKDNLTTSRLASEAMGLAILRVLLPTMEKLSGFLVENAKNGERLENAAHAADAGLKILATGVTVVSSAFKILGEHIAAGAALFVNIARGDFSAAWDIVKNRGTEASAVVTDAMESIDKTWSETGDKVAATAEKNGAKLAAPALAATEKIKKARKEADAEFQAFLKIHAIEEEAGKSTQDFYKKQGDQTTAITQKQIEQRQELADMEAKLQYRLAHGGLGVVMDEDTEGVEQVGKQIQKTDDFARQMGLTFSSAFEKAVIGGKKLQDVLKGVAQDIGTIVLRKTVTEPIGNAISGAITNSGIGNLFSSLFGGGKADGGPLDEGKWYIAGEHGPEPIWGGGAGAFAAGYGGGMGGITNVYIDAKGADQAGIAHLWSVLQSVNASVERRSLAINQRAANVRGRTTVTG